MEASILTSSLFSVVGGLTESLVYQQGHFTYHTRWCVFYPGSVVAVTGGW